MNLCLGTVQFGTEYGIQHAGQPSPDEAINIIDVAIRSGVTALDTASSYGTAEELIGNYLNKHSDSRNRVKIISKLPSEPSCVRSCLNISLKRLKADYIDYYLLHNTTHIYDNKIVDALFELKSEGLIKSIGASVYTPDEARIGIELGFDVLQIPYSIFDQRMSEFGILDYAQENGVELHSRSIFTQGLMLMDEAAIPLHLEKARPIVNKLELFCNNHNISRLQLAVAFVSRHKSISYIVFGVDNAQQLTEIINASKCSVSEKILEEATHIFLGIDENIIMPNLWKA